jgi:hypothetical protein
MLSNILTISFRYNEKSVGLKILQFLTKTNFITCSEQIGFKKHSRTSDHILTLKCLIDKAFKLSKSLYVCFIDLRKTFDTVNREALYKWDNICYQIF